MGEREPNCTHGWTDWSYCTVCMPNMIADLRARLEQAVAWCNRRNAERNEAMDRADQAEARAMVSRQGMLDMEARARRLAGFPMEILEAAQPVALWMKGGHAMLAHAVDGDGVTDQSVRDALMRVLRVAWKQQGSIDDTTTENPPSAKETDA